jgi:hypothetical protein
MLSARTGLGLTHSQLRRDEKLTEDDIIAYLVLTAGIQAIYLYERLGGWRRMVSLRVPARRNALGSRPPAHQPA